MPLLHHAMASPSLRLWPSRFGYGHMEMVNRGTLAAQLRTLLSLSEIYR
jgi:hypothetical protein